MASNIEVKEAMIKLVDALNNTTRIITNFNDLIDEVDETINNFPETLSSLSQQDLINSIDEVEKELQGTFINDLPATTRTRGVFWSLIPFGDKDGTLRRVFEINTFKDVKNARGVGSETFKEIESLRIKAGLNYKL